MTAQQIIDRAKTETGQSSGGLTDAKLLTILNEGITDFIRFTKCRYKQSSVQQTAYESSVSLPTDYLQTIQFRWGVKRQLYPKSERTLDYKDGQWIFQVGTPENVIFWNYNEVRLKPIPSAAATFVHRYHFIPSDITLSEEPDVPETWHDAFIEWLKSQMYLIFREYQNFDDSWAMYVQQRLKAKAQSKTGTPDTLQTQIPVTTFNYPYWDQGFRRFK